MYYDTHHHHRQVMRRYQPASGRPVPAAFVNAIASAFDGSPRIADFDGFTIESLLDYIRRTHEFYLNSKLPEIGQTILALYAETEEDNRLLSLLEASFIAYYRKLDLHIRQEERLLLPYIEQLCLAVQWPFGLFSPLDLQDGYSLEAFERAHADTEADLSAMQACITAYRPADTEASPYRILVSQLESFESDLHVHAFIEDEVLIPKARQLENLLKYKKASP